MKRRHFLAASAAIAAVPLAAPQIARAQSGKVLRVVPQGDLAVLDPGMNTATVTRNHGFMIYDTLFGLDAAGNAVPEMVEGFVTEDGSKRWTLKLRDGLKFHDGAPVLASDAVASLKRWARRDPFGKTLFASVDALTATDDKTLEFRLKSPFPLLPQALAKTVPYAPFILPARVIPEDPGKQITDYTGSGPFRFVAGERVPGSRVVYEKNTAYVPRGSGAPGLSSGPKRVFVDRVEWQIIPDAATAMAAIQRGEIDWLERPFPDLLPVARKEKSLKVEITNRAGTIAFLQFNHLYPPFNNPAIRRLVLSAIDQRDYTDAIAGSDDSLKGGKIGIFLPGAPMANTAGLEVFKGRKDYDNLKKELIAAGYQGEKVVMLVGTDSPVNNAASEVTADLFRKMGFNVDYVATDWGTVVQRRTSQQPPDKGGWNIFAVSADGDFYADPTVVPAVRANGKDAWMGWPDSPEIERLFHEWFTVPDLAARQEVARQLQVQTFKDVTWIPVAQVFLPTVFRNNISGVLPGFIKFWNVQKA